MIAIQAGVISEKSQRSVAENQGVSQSRLAYANAVLQHAPDLADAVVSGSMPIAGPESNLRALSVLPR